MTKAQHLNVASNDDLSESGNSPMAQVKEEAGMNLPYVHAILMAADEQDDGLMTLAGIEADHEVRLMAQADLVEATFDHRKDGLFTTINRVTAMGQTFLRAFKGRRATL